MTTRLLAALLILSWLAATASAQTPPDQRFLVESIVVSGVENPSARDIVSDQSLLVAGRSYSEQEIREAVYRVRRLPFVLGAELSLRDGKAPDGKQVVITVDSNSSYFLVADVTGTYNGDAQKGQDATDWGVAATGGGRWFLGPMGLASVSAQGFDGAGVEIGQADYTRYGLFGRGAAVKIAASTNVDRDLNDFYTGSLALEVPLTGNHSLRSTLDWFQSKSDSGGFRSRNESGTVGLSWVYDSTDDPLFPTRGRSALGGARYSDSKQTFQSTEFSSRQTSHDIGLQLAGSRFWSLTTRQSVSAAFNASWDRTTLAAFRETNENSLASVKLGHATDLQRRLLGSGGVDLRWENSLEVLSSRFDGPFSREWRSDARVTTGLALRNRWAITRLSFTYLDNLHEDERFKGPVL